MPDVLAVGLTEALARWLEQRVPGVSVTTAHGADDALEQLTGREWALLIVDDVASSSAPSVVRQTRQRPLLANLPVIYALDHSLGSDGPGNLVGELGVHQLLYHPLDQEELAHQVASALGLALPSTHPDRTALRQQTSEAVAALWERFKDANLNRVSVLDGAVLRLREGTLDPELRRKAEQEAHKLAGAVGTFGFIHGSKLARQIEKMLQPKTDLGQAEALLLADLVVALRQELEKRLETTVSTAPATAKDGPLILVVDDDQDVAEQLALAAASQGLRAEVASNPSAAREIVARRSPDAVLLDLSFPGSTEDGLSFLAELSERTPSVPVMVLTARDEFTDRVEVARLGGRGFLRKSMSPAHVVESVIQMLNRLHANDSKILAVDDDPQVLAALLALLEPRGLNLTTIEDPLKFWDALKETSPDLVMLDVDMPHLSGIELCRVVRNESRWASMPVLFLTARTDADTVYRIFAAGADDYVAKPIIGPELVTRITNRLERVRLYRSMAETDFLTGVANPRKASQVLDHLLLLAKRHAQPMCLSIVDLDHFKRVNDQYGHTAGDAVLRGVGDILLRRFRGTDLVARWGGEEFILGLYGMTREGGVARVAEALDLLRREIFRSGDGVEFKISFSAGVAQFPDDGTEFLALYRAADEALYRAKEAGRDRVLPAAKSRTDAVPRPTT